MHLDREELHGGPEETTALIIFDAAHRATSTTGQEYCLMVKSTSYDDGVSHYGSIRLSDPSCGKKYGIFLAFRLTPNNEGETGICIAMLFRLCSVVGFDGVGGGSGDIGPRDPRPPI